MNPKIIIVAHDIRSSHNVGSLLRTCDGIGVEKVIFSGYTPYPIKKNDERLPHISKKVEKQIEKTALGAQYSQQWEQSTDINGVIKELKAKDYHVCALEQAPGSTPINRFEVPLKVAFIIGSETEGLEESVLKQAKTILEIPMYGQKESYNVIQATAMALYSFRFAGK